jgi:hypothetical protein
VIGSGVAAVKQLVRVWVYIKLSDLDELTAGKLVIHFGINENVSAQM